MSVRVSLAEACLCITDEHQFTDRQIKIMSEIKDNDFVKNVIRQRRVSDKQWAVIMTIHRQWIKSFEGFDASEVVYDPYAAPERA